jgi:hypothetical protein
MDDKDIIMVGDDKDDKTDNVIDMFDWARKKKADIDRANRSRAIKNILGEANKLDW